jgi:hypothetical protein
MGILAALGSLVWFFIGLIGLAVLIVVGFFVYLYYRARHGIKNAEQKYRQRNQRDSQGSSQGSPSVRPESPRSSTNSQGQGYSGKAAKPNEVVEVELLEVKDVEVLEDK